MERGFSRIWRIFADSFCVNCVLRLYLVIAKIYGLNTDLSGFTQICADFI
ncbi:MAG: hypothetical protein FWG87_07915 [Defluviitaleaceae bacterium]|nr:hypothetical protein [Defluviitaleaceae bacterium]